MFYHKRTAAFLVGLLLCAASVISPVCGAYAEPEEITAEEISDSGETAEEFYTDDYVVSGDFAYSLTVEGKICIENCSSETEELVIPDTIDGIAVAEIGRTAFGNTPDQSYKSITIPASVEYVSAENPFMYCPSLEKIIVESGNSEYISDDGALYTKDMTKLICYPQAKQGSILTVPEGVEEIENAAVISTVLTEINFPSTLRNIGYYAFNDNQRIKAVDLSGTAAEEIGIGAFLGCSSLSEVLLPDTLYYIGGASFALCPKLENITLPESLETIGQSAFIGTGLTSITVPDSVSEIGYSAFGYDENENPVEGFTIIGSYNSAAYIYATDSDEEYDYYNDFEFMTPEVAAEYAEYNSFNKDMAGDYEYTVINGEAVITVCLSSDIDIEVPAEINGLTVTRIYTSAFAGNASVSIKLPDTVKTVDKLAFYGCEYLESLDLGGAEDVGDDAFIYCSALRRINVSGNCKNLGGDEPFISCTSLEEINVSDGDGEYCSEDGILYSKDKSTLIVYPASKSGKSFKTPDSVKEIAMSAFCYNQYLEKIELPKIEKIWQYGFEGCQALNEVTFSKNLDTVAENAFIDCANLKSVRLYKELTVIGDYSFGYFTNLEAAEEDGSDAAILNSDFKIYADKDTTAYRYAESCGIEVISGTVEVMGSNMSSGFLYAAGGICGAAVLGIAGFAVGKKLKKKKK